uniref:DCD domain-containing protein n=1 Tax=Leersia perrieri TaxID=77586 RepID=A0A0D9XGV1_9ORYZ
MWQELPKRSYREDAPMEGAIFMSNTATRELCFRTGIFGLPIEYQSFVENIRQGMPLFLFDHTERKLYGVFEAVSDGGLNINRSAFSSIGCSYPAQVCFKIVWKCRPLTKDEFSPAINENYYSPWKFYFDLSYQQVVHLYQLFDEKRVEHPICNRPKSVNLEKDHFRKGTKERKSLSPNIPQFPADHPGHGFSIPASNPRFSTVEASYCASTSMHQAVPQPNMSMPLGTKPFGVKFAPVHSSHQDQAELPYNNNMLFPNAAPVDATATQVAMPCSQTTKYHPDQFTASQSYLLSHKHMDNSLLSGCVARDPTDELKLSSANHSYPPSGYACSYLPPPGYKTRDTIGVDINYVGSTLAPSYPQFPLANAQGNATNCRDYYDDHCKQCQLEDIYGSEHQHFSKTKASPSKLNRQDIPVYPVIPELAFDQRKESFNEKDYENTHYFHRTDTVSSGLGNSIGAYMPDHVNRSPDIRSERNIIAAGQNAQSSVFSRLSRIPPPLPQEIPGPSLNQLVHSLSQKAGQWSNKDEIITNALSEQLVSEQVMGISCPLAELNQPGFIEEVSTGLPFMNFKRRSETGKLDANLGEEINGKVKRRKLVRPAFGEDNNSASSEKELQANRLEEKKHCHAEKKFSIDLNRPASTDGILAKEDDTTALLFPSVFTMTHTDKPCEVNKSEPNSSNTTEEKKKQDPSFNIDTQTEKISLDLSVADLSTIDKSELQAILSTTLSQAIDNIRSGKLNNSEETVSKICAKDSSNLIVSESSEGDSKL